ncbi:MAG: hypothetical protein AAGI70_00280 [Pseudomonadota bacterium]
MTDAEICTCEDCPPDCTCKTGERAGEGCACGEGCTCVECDCGPDCGCATAAK